MGRKNKKLSLDQFHQQEQQKQQQAQSKTREQQVQLIFGKKHPQKKTTKKVKSTTPSSSSTPTTTTSTNATDVFGAEALNYKPSSHNQSVQSSLVKYFPHLANNQIILNYVGSIMESQNNDDVAMEESSVIQWVKNILQSCNNTQQPIDQQLSDLLQKLKDDNLLTERVNHKKSSIQLLDQAINLGKEYELIENSFRKETTVDEHSSKWNQELDWDQKMVDDIQKKKEKRKQKERAQRQREYEEYLNKRGLTYNTRNQVVKLHRHDLEIKGTRDVKLDKITLRVGDKTLLENASLQLEYGRRYGLIGRNGVGKTTLLRNIFDRELEGIPLYLQIFHVEQEAPSSEKSALELVLETDVERLQLLQEEKRLLQNSSIDDVDRLQQIYDRLEQIDAHSAEARAAQILAGLSFTEDMMRQPSNELSGGWRMRIALARGLFVEPDVLLLDEPTNNLSLHCMLWLESYLKNYPKTLVIVSHARSFLNAVVTDVIHFNNERQLEVYKGNYDTFEKTRNAKLLQQSRLFDAQQKQKKHIQSYIDRFRYKASTAKMAQSRVKLLNKMEFVPEVTDDPKFQLKLPECEPVPPPHIQCVDVCFAYSKTADASDYLLKDVNFAVDMSSRIALVGRNGVGKSTFMKILLQELTPLKGKVEVNRKIRITRFSQHHNDQLNMSQTPLEYMKEKYKETDDQKIRAHLGTMGVVGSMQLQPIYTLSGGQKSRVSFADITYTRPHIILMDEISNHLDIDTIDALIHAMNEYNGGILLISHDEYLIERTCDEIWICDDGRVKKFNGDFDEYKKKLAATL